MEGKPYTRAGGDSGGRSGSPPLGVLSLEVLSLEGRADRTRVTTVEPCSSSESRVFSEEQGLWRGASLAVPLDLPAAARPERTNLRVATARTGAAVRRGSP